MHYSDALIKATEDYANGGSWETFQAVLETDWFRGAPPEPCSREHAARQLVLMQRQRADVENYRLSKQR
jgi:hypothetical protein